MNEKYYFFWNGPFSQWYISDFVDEKYPNITFNCAEQYMMYRKAILMNDNNTADRILDSVIPRFQKSLGRSIRNFDGELWDKHKFDIVVRGNVLKFSQNVILLKEMKKSGDKIFVEASPYDKIWGIGLDENTAKNLSEEKWKGENLLGKALVKAREIILK